MNQDSKSETRNPALWLAGLLFFLTFGLFAPCTQNGFVNFDDGLVIENPHVTSGLNWANVKWAFSNGYANGHCQPLTWLSHMADCRMFGLQPEGHHRSSVVLHAAGTALFFLFLSGATGCVWRSLLAAVLFGAHPLRVESVAWVAERKDVLSVFWAVLSLWAYARWAGMNGESAWRKRSFYWLALLFFVCGLLSKVMLVTLPVILLLLDVWPLNRWRLGRENGVGLGPLLMEKIPFFALSLAAGLTVLLAHPEGAVTNPMPCFSFGVRLSNALVSYWRYVFKTFWPVDLAVYYPYPSNWPWPAVLLAAAGLLLVSIWVAGRVKSQPWNFAGWFWFVVALVPVIGLVLPGTHSIADRYMYLPSMGLSVALVWTGHDLSKRWPRWRWAWDVAVATAIAGCLALTSRQIACWRDSETLFRHALAVTENNIIARVNLGEVLIAKGQPAEAVEHLERALKMSPRGADIHLNLAVAYQVQGRLPEALTHYHAGLALTPDDAKAHFLFGTYWAQAGQYDEAVKEFHEAIRLKPDYPTVYVNLGSALRRQGKLPEAIAQFETAIRLQPGNADAWNNLGVALASAGRFGEAAARFEKAVQLNPGLTEARRNLEIARENLRRKETTNQEGDPDKIREEVRRQLEKAFREAASKKKAK
jgi:tetratricopeptide (TPR) repeat protein